MNIYTTATFLYFHISCLQWRNDILLRPILSIYFLCRIGYCVFVDAEHALDPTLAEAIGVDTRNLLLSQPDSGEQALSLVDTLIRSGSVDVVVVDSVRRIVSACLGHELRD